MNEREVRVHTIYFVDEDDTDTDAGEVYTSPIPKTSYMHDEDMFIHLQSFVAGTLKTVGFGWESSKMGGCSFYPR